MTRRIFLTLLIVACLLPLLPAVHAAAVRLPTGTGHTVKVKGHRKALRASTFSLQRPGFSASRGPMYTNSCGN